MEIHLIAAFLAAWRITSALNREVVGMPFRKLFAGETFDKQLDMYSYRDNLLAELVTCFMCLSFWVSVACFVLVFVFPYLLYPFAISTLVIFLEKAY